MWNIIAILFLTIMAISFIVGIYRALFRYKTGWAKKYDDGEITDDEMENLPYYNY